MKRAIFFIVVIILCSFSSQLLALPEGAGARLGMGDVHIDPKTIGGMWLFDEDSGNIATDSSGNGNDGKLMNGPKWVDGKFGKALSFDGVNDRVSIVSSLSGLSNFTYAEWVWIDSTGPDDSITIQTGNGEIIYYPSTDKFDITIYSNRAGGPGPTCYRYLFTVNGIEDKWTHLSLVVKSDNTAEFYVNGSSVSIGPRMPDSPSWGHNYATIGGGQSTFEYAYWFKGSIDEVVVFNKALNVADINSIMTQGLEKAITANMQYYISSPSNEKDRGGLIIPSDTFPEGKGSAIPIYIPSIVDGSNKIKEDTAWKTVKEINKAKLNFEWEEMLANFNFEGADTPTESAFSAIAGLIEAVNKAISISVCNIIIQKDSEGNFRAIIQVGDPDRRTFIGKYAGEGVIDPLADSFWLVQATFSDQIAKTFSLEPDNYPNVFYTMTINIDALHKDDSYIGYLSLSDKDKIVITPKVYPKDELKIIRFHQFIIPYKKETVLALSGDGFINFMEGPAEPGFIKILTPSLSESAIVVQGHSPIEIRVYDSQSRVTGLVKGEIKEDIPESIYDESHKIVIILSPTDAYRYEIVGTDDGEYGLEVTSIKGKESNTFTATNVPTSANAVHEYSVDWNALSKDKGVTINIDSNGDGKIDETINSGASFTEYNCDVNSDGVVNILDLVIVGKSFGKDVNNAKADVNKDGIIDVLDLNIVGQHLGEVYK